MEQKISQSDGKKPYEKPLLTTISLRPEEAVLGACKVFGHSGGNIFAICGLGCPNAGS
jgi:hypothetical protein